MNDYGKCACGFYLVRRIDDDETQFECIGCKQLLFKFEDSK